MSNLIEQLSDIVEDMKNSGIGNYIVPGVSSYLIGGGDKGKVRLFESSRNQQQSITPHSHRFDLTCIVLSGVVRNRIWAELPPEDHDDLYQISKLKYSGEVGEHEILEMKRKAPFTWDENAYYEGDCYTMTSDVIHSIEFERDTSILIFEGPQRSDTSVIIEPVVDDVVIPTYIKHDWMFKELP